MFETIDSAEILYPATLATAGVRVWTYTSHGLNLPWFHVSMGNQRDDGHFGQVIFASTLSQVLQLKARFKVQMELKVMLVSPPYLNGTDRWRMECLREVWRASGSANVVYVVQGRRHYAESGEDCAPFEPANGYERIY